MALMPAVTVPLGRVERGWIMNYTAVRFMKLGCGAL